MDPWNSALRNTGQGIQDVPLVIVQNSQVPKNLPGIPISTSLSIAISYSSESTLAGSTTNVSRPLLDHNVLSLPALQTQLQLVDSVLLEADFPFKRVPLLRRTRGRRWSIRRGETGTHIASLKVKG